MPDLVHRFQRLNAYERDSGGSILASLDSIPDAKRSGQPAIKAINLAAHIQAARLEWNARLTGRPSVDLMFFDHAEIGQVEQLTAEANERWDAYIQELTPAELDRIAHYNNMQGQPNRCAAADILTHVFNHGSYHRGQIAMLVTQAGGERAVTDFIFYAYREPEAD